ncbi:MAG: ATP-binding protein [Pseudoruegeria sp.]
MKAGMNRYRIAVLAGIGLLVLLLVNMTIGLLGQLRDLSIAEDDNLQWSISQIDVEFANLNAIISKRLSDPTVADDEIKLRLDIAISRLGILRFGRASILFADGQSFQNLIAPIESFSDQAIAIADKIGPISDSDLLQLRALTENVRPDVRKIALMGVELSAVRNDAQRIEFSRQLTRTGGIAIALLFLMAALMAILDRLLDRAAKRDAALLTSTQLLKSTVAASLDAIVTANDKGQIIEFNDAAEEVFGWRRNEIIGKTMENTIIPQQMRDAHNLGMKRFLAGNAPRVVDGGRVELSALRKSGEEFPIEINITSAQDGGRLKFIAYVRDISERKINEQNLIDARDQAQRTDKAKSQFLAVMSHEMRTPLNGILGVLDLMKTTKMDRQQMRYTDIATASSEILLEHINDALDITRIEAGALQLSEQIFDLPELAHSIVDVLEPLASEKQLTLTLRIDEAMRRGFYGDSNRLRQILTNLIGNAVKFTTHGSIIVHISGIHGPDTSSLRFSVTDTGAGIQADQVEQIFEDFVALAQSEGRQSRGDGLGLSISRKIARQMKGDISVLSELGKGSTFTLTVPMQRKDCGSSLEDDIAENTSVIAKDRLEVLVTEDNNINRKVMRDMLQGLGHSVSEAVNGVECLKQAQTKRFDLIFMDISMPTMGGIEATNRLRTSGGPNAKTRIAGLTAHGIDEFQAQAEYAGMNEFHTKPIRLEKLREILSGINAHPSPAPHSDTLQELCRALGADKVQSIGDEFFSELDKLVKEVDSGHMQDRSEDLAEAAHKIKGAAAILDQEDLETHFTELEQHARNNDLSDLPKRLKTIVDIARIARVNFATMVKNTRT